MRGYGIDIESGIEFLKSQIDFEKERNSSPEIIDRLETDLAVYEFLEDCKAETNKDVVYTLYNTGLFDDLIRGIMRIVLDRTEVDEGTRRWASQALDGILWGILFDEEEIENFEYDRVDWRM